MSDAGISVEINMPKIIITGKPETLVPQVIKEQRESSVGSFLASSRQVLPGLANQEQSIQAVLHGKVRALAPTEAQALLRAGGVEIADPEKAHLIYQALLARAKIAAIPSDQIRERVITTGNEVLMLSEWAAQLGIPSEELQTLLNRCLIQKPGKNHKI